MKIESKQFRVRAGNTVDLKKLPTRVKPFYKSEKDYEELLARHVRKMGERQSMLYAHDRYALLVIFQAMDAAGKDGAIKHVMSGVNPQGCQVFSFKHPSAQELDHDFLWRTTGCLPERGRIGIFNRSYYEEVLIVRVHPEIRASQNLPDETLDDDDFWKHRYRSINELEKLEKTVADYNAACVPGTYKPLELDGLATHGLAPPKSNWALPLDEAPFHAYPIISSNVFTFGGLKVDTAARVLNRDGDAIPGLYAAGETVGMYYGNYTGATSVLKGMVFGRLAGVAGAAARRAAH